MSGLELVISSLPGSALRVPQLELMWNGGFIIQNEVIPGVDLVGRSIVSPINPYKTTSFLSINNRTHKFIPLIDRLKEKDLTVQLQSIV